MNNNSKILLFFIIALAGCKSAVPKRVQNVFRPTKSSYVSIRFYPSKCMNADEMGEPLPTVVRVYKIKSKEEIEKASFVSVWGKLTPSENFKELIIYPDVAEQKIKINRSEDLDYIAIVAGLRHPIENKWKQIIKFPDFKPELDLFIGKESIKIGGEKMQNFECKAEN